MTPSVYLVQDFKFRQVLLQYLYGKAETRRAPRRRISLPSMAVNATRSVGSCID